MPYIVDHPKTVRDEFHRFLMFSSVRGVPRTLRARSSPWTFIWFVSVITFCTISLYFTCNVIIQYLQFHTVFQNKYYFRSTNVPFPSVTICNLQPPNYAVIKRIQNNTDASKHSRQLFKLLEFLKQNSAYKQLTTKSFLMQNWGTSLIQKYGIQFNEFVMPATCNVSYVEDHKIKSSSCGDFKVLMVPDTSLFQCFMISPADSITHNTYSVEMDLYLNTEPTLCGIVGNCTNKIFGLDDSVGAYVSVHTSNTYPEVSQMGIHIHPGTKTTIELTETRKETLDQSLGKCTTTTVTPLLVGDKLINFAYKTTVCQRLEIQKHIVKQCKCVDADLPIDESMRGVPFCGQLSTNDTTYGYICNTLAQNVDIGNNKCPTSCQYISYQTTTYQSLWPAKNNELDFYKLRIQGQSHFDDKFSEYERALGLSANGSYTELRKLLRDTNLIRENFVRLKVFRPEISLVQSTEKLQITFEALVSQIGGAFCLWCGVTVITLVEIAEFFYYVTKKILGAKRSPHEQETSVSLSNVHVQLENTSPLK